MKRVITILFLLIANHLIAKPIKVKTLTGDTRVLYFENDSLVLERQSLDFSPDSQLCVILDKERTFFTLYNFKMEEIGKIKYDLEVAQSVVLSNDMRYLTYGYKYNFEEQNQKTVFNFYSSSGSIQMDTVFNFGSVAFFINTDELIIITPINNKSVYTERGIDSRVMIFDSSFKQILCKLVNFTTYEFLQPSFSTIENEYEFTYRIYGDDENNFKTKRIKK